PCKVHPGRNTDSQVCARVLLRCNLDGKNSGENPRWAHRSQACVPLAHCSHCGQHNTPICPGEIFYRIKSAFEWLPTVCEPPCRRLITKVLLSPYCAHGP